MARPASFGAEQCNLECAFYSPRARNLTVLYITGRTCLLLLFCLACSSASLAQTSLNEQYREISRLMAQQKYEQAITESKALIERAPHYHNAYIALAQAASEAGQPEPTRIWLESLLARTPPQTMAYAGLALVRQFQRDYTGATENYEKALRAFPDDDVVAEFFAINYFSQKKIQEGETWFKSLLASQPDSVAGHQGLGVLYTLADRRAEALAELDRVISLQPQNVVACSYKGRVLDKDSRYPQAAETLQACLNLLQANPDDLREKLVLSGLGGAHLRLGNFPEAAKNLNRSIELAHASDDLSGEESALTQLASLHYRQNNYLQALEYWRRALEVSKALGLRKTKTKTNRQRHLGGIGDVYYKLGDVATAEQTYLEALALSVEAKDEANQSSVLKSLGDLYIEQGKLSQAIAIEEQALALGQKLKNLPNQLGALNSLSTLYRQMGDATKATDYVQQALKLLEGRSNPLWEGESWNNLGLLHLRFGDVPKAKSAFEKTLAIDQRAIAPHVVWQAHSGLADAYFQLGELDKAREHYQAAIETIESVRARLGGEEEKAAFFQDKVDVYKKHIALLLNPRLKNASTADAFHYVERARARAFLDRLAEARVEVEQKTAPDLTKRQQELQQRISQLTTQLIQERSQEISKQDKTKIAQLEKALGQADTELADWLRELRRRDPRYAALQYPEPIKLAAAQRLLDDKTILLSYSLSEPQSFLFALARNDFQVKRLPPETTLRESVDKLLAAITDRNNPSPAEYRRQAVRLSQQLLQPASSMLAGKTSLVIVADGVLLRLPFEVLFWPGTPALGDLRRLPYLVTRSAISYVPSASVLAELQNEQRTTAPKAFIAFGDPIYRQRDEGVSLLRAAGAERVNLQPLPYSREEINGIAKLFPDDDRAVFFAADATEENVKAPERLSRYKMVHFSTHGYVNEARPHFSGLVMSQTASSRAEDGLLSAYEIFNLRLQADLVVLSACETGLGKDVKGEGLMSLMRAFMYAGTSSVVVSLWNVNDESAADLMIRFYRNLKTGMSKGEALRQAQLEMIRDNGFPFFWAPFILVGKA
ncbi:MAG TPA: CHAT domain-containing protein [Pyrinomonadaceae bacterium]|nr:CHAT domain-containing protein [Pyrinomonadaceae bacterium]